MSSGLRILMAAALGVLIAAGYLMYVERQARLHGEAPAAAAPTAAPQAAGRVKLHKCIDAAGATSIQSEQCPPGSRTLWTREVTPEPGSEPSLEITQPVPAEAEAVPVSFACRMARANRKAYLAGEAGPITGDETALREQTVREACRPQG